MSEAFRALMDRLIDYAGLFPPASLDLPTAVDRYARHRGTAEAWMLNRFIAPAESLGGFGDAAADHATARDPWSLSVLVGAREDPDVAVSRTEAQGAAVAALEARLAGAVVVEVLEAPVPTAAAGPDCGEFLDRLLPALAAAGLAGREVFVEAPAAGDDAAVIDAVAAAAARHAGPGGPFRRVGAKLRCGGLVAEAFPTPERVAAVIAHARDRGVALKFTAGLHHPVRFRAAEPEVMMHGFLNVFGAACLAWGAGLDGDSLAACIAETDAAAFSFAGDEYQWRGHVVDAATVRRVRHRWLCGFGSCSFTEPRDDLFKLGLF